MTENKKPGMSMTALVVTILIITLGCYDLVVVLRNGVEESVSRTLQDTVFGSPLISFSFGFVAGHIFGYLKPSEKWAKK